MTVFDWSCKTIDLENGRCGNFNSSEIDLTSDWVKTEDPSVLCEPLTSWMYAAQLQERRTPSPVHAAEGSLRNSAAGRPISNQYSTVKNQQTNKKRDFYPWILLRDKNVYARSSLCSGPEGGHSWTVLEAQQGLPRGWLSNPPGPGPTFHSEAGLPVLTQGKPSTVSTAIAWPVQGSTVPRQRSGRPRWPLPGEAGEPSGLPLKSSPTQGQSWETSAGKGSTSFIWATTHADFGWLLPH